MELPDEILAHYQKTEEKRRLFEGTGELERIRTQEIISRYLPAAPARVILDVGGGSGAYSCWLASEGHAVHLVDPVDKHVEEAREALEKQNASNFSCQRGDARALNRDPDSVDIVLLLGPLYHLTEIADRSRACKEALRVLKPGGLLFAAGISRFASLLDGLVRNLIRDPEFREIVKQDLATGQHRNPTRDPQYFTTAYFHHPDQLRSEIQEAGFDVITLVGVDGPGWLLQDFERRWKDPEAAQQMLHYAKLIEAEPSMIGLSAHLLVVAQKPR